MPDRSKRLSERIPVPLPEALDRIEVGAYYTNGVDLYEVVKVLQVGAVTLHNSSTGDAPMYRLDTFRDCFWKVRDPREDFA